MDYNKLVRDRIPEIIAAQGERPVTRVLDDQAYAVCLEKKLEAGPDLAGHWDEVKDIFRQNKSCITKISRV